MTGVAAHIYRWASFARLVSADLQHGGQFDQLGLVLVGVVLAEEKLGS
jgi:hypothetical protein